jgi:hypothetical protein
MDQSSSSSSDSGNGYLVVIIIIILVVVVLPFITCIGKYDYCNDERRQAQNTHEAQSSFSIELCGDYLICENCGQYHDNIIQRSSGGKFLEVLLPIFICLLFVVLFIKIISAILKK